MPESLADLYLVLSRAFLPPLDDEACDAFCRDLAADLGHLAAELPHGLQPAATAFGRAAAGAGHRLLRGYSQLFLVPPVPAPLNIGLYVDGCLMGPSTDALRAAYGRLGLAAGPPASLPDHLALVLEFLGLSYRSCTAAEADQARDAFVRPWVGAFVRRIEQEIRREPDSQQAAAMRPYLHLAEILMLAAWQGRVPAEPAAAPVRPRRPADGVQLCRLCGSAVAPLRDVRSMRKILAKRGLDAAFLDVCPDCRAADMGLVTMRAPELKRPGWGFS